MLKHNAAPTVVCDLFGAGGECDRVRNGADNGTEFKPHVSSAEQISCVVHRSGCHIRGHRENIAIPERLLWGLKKPHLAMSVLLGGHTVSQIPENKRTHLRPRGRAV
jgi:hypothetical protein